MLEPGKYIARITDYGIRSVGEKKTPQLAIEFTTKEDGKSVWFQNFLTEGTTSSSYWNNLMDTLVTTGALRSKKFTDIAKGKDGNALCNLVDLQVVVDWEMDDQNNKVLNKKGEAITSVRFINDPNRSGMKGLLAETEAISVLNSLNLDAHILQSEQRTKVSVGAGQTISESDVPF